MTATTPLPLVLHQPTAVPVVRVEEASEDNIFAAWSTGKSRATVRAYTAAIDHFAKFVTDWLTTTVVGVKTAQALDIETVDTLDDLAGLLFRAGQPRAT